LAALLPPRRAQQQQQQPFTASAHSTLALHAQNIAPAQAETKATLFCLRYTSNSHSLCFPQRMLVLCKPPGQEATAIERP
jgi:hypothetical protein